MHLFLIKVDCNIHSSIIELILDLSIELHSSNSDFLQQLMLKLSCFPPFEFLQAVALLVIETLELFGALLLLEFTTKHKPVSFFQIGKMRSERSWMVTAVLGFGVLVIAMFFTSFLADKLVDTKVGLVTSVLILIIYFCPFIHSSKETVEDKFDIW